MVVKGKVGEQGEEVRLPGQLVEKSNDESYAFVEKLWAMRRIGEIIDELDLKGKNDELVKELVALATKHGILTPYTSFLADENPPPQLAGGGTWGMEQARQALRRLDQAEGRAGFAQRAEKKLLQEADDRAAGVRVRDARARCRRPMPRPTGAAGWPARRHARGGSARRDRVGPASATATSKRTAKSPCRRVQIVGNETLYKRGSQWFAANAKDVDLKRDADKVKTLERFSDEYFKLVAANTATENAVLARQQAGEELVIKLRGQIYLIR